MGKLKTKPGPARLLRVTAGGLLPVNEIAVAREAHLAGKFLQRRSDPTLTAAEIALGYDSCCRLSAGGET